MRRWTCRSMLAAGCGLGFALAGALGQDSRPMPDSVKVKPAEAPRTLPGDLLTLPEGEAKKIEVPTIDILGPRPVSNKPENVDPPALKMPEPTSLPKFPELPPLDAPKLDAPSKDKPHAAPPIRPISARSEDVKVPIVLPRLIREKEEKADLEAKPKDPGLKLPDQETPKPKTVKAMPVSAGDPEKAASLKMPEPGKITVSSAPATGAPPKPFWDSAYDPNKDADRAAVAELSKIEAVKPREMWWANVSYLQWSIDQGKSPAIGLGALPVPGSTDIGRLFPFVPDGKSSWRGMPGIKIAIGTWLEPNFRWGLEATSLTLFDQTQKRFFSSPGDVFILRPFIDANTGTPVLSQVAGGGSRSGLLATAVSQCLQGEEIHALYNWRGGFVGGPETPDAPQWGVHFLAGYRYLQYRNDLTIHDSVTVFQGPADGPFSFATRDSFQAMNEFHGGQVGVKGHYETNRFSFELLGKLAVGSMTQTVDVYGASMNLTPNVASDRPGGFLALASNTGTFTKQTTTLIPELAATLGLKLSRNAIFTVGYNVLYIPQVARAGDQVDPVINPGFLPYGPAATSLVARPAFRLQDSSLWAQGVSVGLTLQY